MVPITSLVIPIVLSAVLVFVASSLVHMVLGYHRADYGRLPKEDEVQAALRPGIGKMLVTVSVGHALYEHPSGSCGTSCQSIWPPLLMPTGKTIPKGAACLKTVKLGSGLQVTYHGQRLYTFTGDSGHSVNGNGVAGFVAAKVTKACP